MGSVATSTGTASEFRVLGPVEAVRSGQPLRLGGRRQRWLLALLLVEPGRAISSDRLIDELWQGKPPRGAEGTLRVYVSRLRSALGENGSSLARAVWVPARSRLLQDRPDGAGRELDRKQLALDAPVPPARVLAGE